MKKFLSRGKEDKAGASATGTASSGEPESPGMNPVKSGSTQGSRDSITEMYPMFEGSSSTRDASGGASGASGTTGGSTGSYFEKFRFNNDPKLSSPLILSKPASVFTKDSEYMGKSIFSKSRKTFSTNQSSYGGSSDRDQGGKKDSSFTYSQPLQILNIPEESNDDLKNKSPSECISDRLQQLYDDLAYIAHQFDSSNINLTTAVINSIDRYKTFISFLNELRTKDSDSSWHFTTYNNSNLRRIMKMYLHFYDNLLKDEVYIKLKLLLVKNFNDFSQVLNTNLTEHQVPQSIVKPQNFAIGVNQGLSLPNEDVLTRIIEKISKTFISLKEQNGSFIAPIARGISNDLHILCLYFGYPSPTDYHIKLTQSLHGLYDDIHIIVIKNQIELASTTDTPISKLAHLKSYQSSQSSIPSANEPRLVQPTSHQKFKLPFRIPTDIQRPPMSLSLSIENSVRTSGTMGGYIYPIIDLKKQPHLESYTNSKFAISCGHVCLDSTTGSTTTEYPHVSAPLSVLIYLYKQALMAQYQKVMNSNNGGDDILIAESRTAYGSVLKQVEEMFPVKRVKVKDPKTKQETYELRNLPKSRFGQIIWGERTLINSTKDNDSKDVEKKLSDLAIIKVNKNLICDQNYLGDDIPFNEFDPALMFDNLYVREVIDLKRHVRNAIDLNVDEVDSELEDQNSGTYNGLPVFKYGSTTKFTKGNLNGIKLVYWLDGAIHSSEFIVNSIENNSAFAAGGDSGSWILTKLEDIEVNSNAKGLGVVGMLHSYDGEFKQFGLYTPMCEILTRLKEVTGIKWGVVGVSPEKGEIYDSDVDQSSEAETTFSDEDDSDIDDGALPPELD